MDGKPLVSVMIGVYNGSAYLGEAIESVLAQSHRPLELNMTAAAHFMHHRYTNFNQPMRIVAPR